MDDAVVSAVGVPGVVQAGWVPVGAIPGTNPAMEPEADLRLIYGILQINWFIRPFDWNILYIS